MQVNILVKGKEEGGQKQIGRKEEERATERKGKTMSLSPSRAVVLNLPNAVTL